MLAQWMWKPYEVRQVGKFRREARNLVLALALIAVPAASPLMTRSYSGAFSDMQEAAKKLTSRSFASESEAVRPQAEARSQSPTEAAPSNPRHEALAEFVAKRYRVSQALVLDFVALAHETGRQLGLDPLLILAVIAVESSFNPIAESGVGAQGLMQVIPKYHPEKLQGFGGAHDVFDPRTNIVLGSTILKEYMRRTGNLSIALQMYAGALSDPKDTYTVKVFNERQRLQQALSQPKRKVAASAQVS